MAGAPFDKLASDSTGRTRHSVGRLMLNILPRVTRQLVGIRSRCPIRMTVRRPSELALWMAAMLVP